MTVVDDIKDKIKKGEKEIKEIIEELPEKVKKGEKEVEEIIEKAIKEGKEKVRKAIRKGAEEVKETAERIADSMSKSKKSGKNVEKFDKKMEKSAGMESLKTEKESDTNLKQRKKELLERAKKLSEKIDTAKTEELKEQIKIKRRTDMLVPLEEYIKSGIYIGKRAVTPQMKAFIYRRRADGLAIFNTDLIDEKLKESIEFLSKFSPGDIILVCKRQTGWETAKMFSKLTGIRAFTKKYPAGILTNSQLPDFFENELTIITDSWLDKNALNDTLKVNKKVLMICDTNNFSKGADQVIIGNNKSTKSLGLIFYLLTRGYCKARNIDANIPDLEWWTEEKN